MLMILLIIKVVALIAFWIWFCSKMYQKGYNKGVVDTEAYYGIGDIDVEFDDMLEKWEEEDKREHLDE